MQYTSRRQTPFTLIEILAVIAIVVIVAGIVIGGAGAAQRKAAEAKARSQISKFEIAVQQYKRDRGYLPSEPDNDIITRGFLESLESQNGNPYLNLDELRFSGSNWMDPFGSSYRYKQPGDENPESYDVWSVGADGDDGTADDIGNFSAD